MNSNIDITQFGNRATTPASKSGGAGLVSPPRRIFSRYILPLALLAGFAGVAGYSFRSAFIPTVDVLVTMPVPAPEQLIAQASFDQDSAPTPDQPTHASPHAASNPTPATTAPSHDIAGTASENPPRPGRGQSLFQAPGWIEPSPYPILISALRSGTVESLEIIEGQHVTSGTVIARLVDEDQRLNVRSHESTLRLKQAQYNAARDRWENPTDLVEAVSTARARAGQLEAQTRRQRDMVELAGLEARIGSTLTRSGYEPGLDTTRKETQLSVTRNELLETRAEVSLNSATLHGAEERLRLRIEDREALETAAAELEEAKVALDNARLQLERSVIKAPTDGTIMRLLASPGSMLSPDMEPGMTVAQMYKPDMLQVRVDVPLAEAAKVRPGLPAEIRVEALPDRRFRGELINIVPEFDLQKNVLPVKVRIYNPDEALRPEMIARVEVFADQPVAPPTPGNPAKQTTASLSLSVAASTPTKTQPQAAAASNVLMIPADALKTVGNSRRVLVVGPDNTVQEKRISSVALQGPMALVKQGLRISDKIIVDPKEISSGRAVHIKGIVQNATH